MSPQNRLTLLLDATLRLALVNPDTITALAHQVCAAPEHYPPRTVARARAVLAEAEEMQTPTPAMPALVTPPAHH